MSLVKVTSKTFLRVALATVVLTRGSLVQRSREDNASIIFRGAKTKKPRQTPRFFVLISFIESNQISSSSNIQATESCSDCKLLRFAKQMTVVRRASKIWCVASNHGDLWFKGPEKIMHALSSGEPRKTHRKSGAFFLAFSYYTGAKTLIQ